MMSDHLSRFEDQIQRLVEGGFSRLFAGRLHPREVALHLIRAMEDNVMEVGGTQPLAPDVYIVRLNPQDHEAILQTESDLADQLAAELVEIARANALVLAQVPAVRLLSDDTITPKEISVTANHSDPGDGTTTTHAMPLPDIRQALIQSAPVATLLVDDERQVPLEQPIINLGRHLDNTIILANPGVSRHHAQIRLRFGSYVIFDLGSKASVTVNGKAVQQHTLRSGDVIRLADTSLIYVEEGAEDPPSIDLDDTQAQPPSTPD